MIKHKEPACMPAVCKPEGRDDFDEIIFSLW